MDMEFGIKTFQTIELLGLEININTTVVVTWIIMLVLILFSLLVKRALSKVPGTLQFIAEMLVEGTHWLVDSTMGEGRRGFAPYIFTLTIYLLIANLTGLVGIRQPTADLNTTFALALITFVLVHYHGIKAKGGLGYIKDFFQPFVFMFPLNIISEIALPVSLSFRLFGNMLGSLIIMALLYAAAAPLIPVIGHMYFDIFAGLIQMFIFVMLTITFITLQMGVMED